MNWYLKVLKQYADFNGRARRQEYWMFILFNIIFSIAAGGAGFNSWNMGCYWRNLCTGRIITKFGRWCKAFARHWEKWLDVTGCSYSDNRSNMAYYIVCHRRNTRKQ